MYSTLRRYKGGRAVVVMEQCAPDEEAGRWGWVRCWVLDRDKVSVRGQASTQQALHTGTMAVGWWQREAHQRVARGMVESDECRAAACWGLDGDGRWCAWAAREKADGAFCRRFLEPLAVHVTLLSGGRLKPDILSMACVGLIVDMTSS